ncbi:MAG: galactose-1-phosphate uridylyltransferase [Candidatus Aminicenantes bacterium]|nr:galactose-1-phosphate uridylyltransferase [Candidatus Aminicenantes bacterium]
MSSECPALRKDPLSGRWVVVAPGRSRRPNEFTPPAAEERRGEAVRCPFCPGNEADTPPEIFALRAPGTVRDGPGWTVRVVPNKYPAVGRAGEAEGRPGPLFETRAGVGDHEVVIDGPEHGLEFSDLPLARRRAVLETYRERVRRLESEPDTVYVQLFKNKGREAGATLRHPHTQIVSLPILPKAVREEIDSSARHGRETGECLLCRLGEEERRAGERLVFENSRFSAFVPFAARFPYEVRVLPRAHAARFSLADDSDIASLAEGLGHVLGRIKASLHDPAFDLVLHQGPATGAGQTEFLHWYLEVIPITTRVAGFEWGTGFHINPVLPEAAASRLRI